MEDQSVNKGEEVGGGGASLDGGTSDPEGRGLDPLIKLHGDIPKFKSDWPPINVFFLE